MANVYLGTAINFGASGAVVSGTAVGTMVVQDYDFAHEADVDEVKDETGNLVQRTYFNPTKTATFNGVIKGTGLADAVSQTVIPALGALVTVTAASYSDLAGTTWIVEGATLKRTNTKATTVSLKLRIAAGITAVSSA